MRLAIATWLRASERSSGTGVSYFDWAVLTPPEQSRNGRHCQAAGRSAARAAARDRGVISLPLRDRGQRLPCQGAAMSADCAQRRLQIGERLHGTPAVM